MSGLPISIRDVDETADLGFVHAMNEAAIPEVSSMTPEAVRHFARTAAYFRVAVRGIRPVGFLIGLTPVAEYQSPNFQWFCARYPDFIYIDRIVIDESSRGSGAGTALYRDIESYARRQGAPRLTCEVNLRPRNDVSLRFHDRFGFREVGTQDTEGGTKTVSLMVKDL